ncbi:MULTISPECIES: hypothetical protein [unclassified Pseudovibrio]|uniref:DUF7683 domain-containing protein n=1 Tax=unclassified Pseudovibrio TaxID=2627060 RepID=UPI0007AE6ED1|nr:MULTISPECIES: hypothetical protein [unclassified Pseudovibrio]KZL00450.1 hypothetical protein PsW74_02875 [Pseudovibrio sp. W74]KZL07450.1 hypothetical protein PsAD14_03835 [Pseudovibrio sp. Ad14]
MPRLIRYFDKATEEERGSLFLINPDLKELQTIFAEPETQPMYDCWPIDSEKARLLRKFVSEDFVFDFSRHEYFLEYDTD